MADCILFSREEFSYWYRKYFSLLSTRLISDDSLLIDNQIIKFIEKIRRGFKNNKSVITSHLSLHYENLNNIIFQLNVNIHNNNGNDGDIRNHLQNILKDDFPQLYQTISYPINNNMIPPNYIPTTSLLMDNNLKMNNYLGKYFHQTEYQQIQSPLGSISIDPSQKRGLSNVIPCELINSTDVLFNDNIPQYKRCRKEEIPVLYQSNNEFHWFYKKKDSLKSLMAKITKGHYFEKLSPDAKEGCKCFTNLEHVDCFNLDHIPYIIKIKNAIFELSKIIDTENELK